MPIPIFLGLGVLHLGLYLLAFARWRSPGHSAILHRDSEPGRPASETSERVSLDRLPDHLTLAGVPLRILLSERSGPGALLRDTLLTRSSTSDW